MRFSKIFSAIMLLCGLTMLTYLPAQATHVRAGDIIAIRTSGLTYCFRVIIYTDDASSADSPFLDFDFGPGTSSLPVEQRRLQRCLKQNIPGTGISANYYGFNPTGASCTGLCYTFGAAGIYTVSFTEENRQGGIENMSNSVGTPFSLSIVIDVNPALGLNTSPILTIPPIDKACVNQKFFHNPGAYDADGDSLVFKMAIPKKDRTENVLGYKSPEVFGGFVEGSTTIPANFSIDSRTGDLTWNSPPKKGIYNIAFIVEEYRNGIKIGQTMRDMQIIVEDCNNKRPILNAPDVCVVADDDNITTSNIIQQTITATDPDTAPQDRITLTSDATQQVYSNPFVVKATFTAATNQFSPATGTFRWDTRGEHVQRQPYIVVFKAKDDPQPPRQFSLVDIQSMLITVKGTPVRNVVATPSGTTISLAWNDYKTLLPTFTATQFNNMQYTIWRKEGCGGTIPCLQNPAQAGYVKIGNTNLNTPNYTDNSKLRPGLTYSYVIVVTYPEPRGGESQASLEVCAFIPIQTPIITKVSVKSTNTTTPNGENEVTFLRPKPNMTLTNFNAQYPVPYKYELYRAQGLSSSTYTLVQTFNDATGSQTSFNFTDTGLDTRTNPHLYKVAWYTGAGQARMIDSDSSSSVRLKATPALNSIILEWEYNTAWSNQNFVHQIFRGEEGQPKTSYVKIGEVLVGKRRFVDDGTFGGFCLDPLKVYGYYVQTKGSYSNPAEIPEPTPDLLRNDSQQAFASPLDNTPPAAPLLKIDSTNCPTKPDCNTPILPIIPQNRLVWQSTKSGNICQDFIATYRLYFKPAGKSEFVLLAPSIFPQPYTDTIYLHTNLPEIRPNVRSQAGCYYVTAVDQQGNESAKSNEVCKDNCLYFQLPNSFTPEGDGKNDTFRACPTPQFVEKVTFSVYGRWGELLYRGSSDIEVNWNGKNNQGQDMPPAVYYYEAKVEFVTIDESKRVQLFKGWVNLMR